MSRSVETEIAVVGAGPAGLAAAARAAERGARVTLIDQAWAPGGQIWRRRPGAAAPRAARRWTARVVAAGVTPLAGAEVIDVVVVGGPAHLLTMVARGEVIRVRARTVVLATGARELFLPFPGWTLPNVLGAAGLQALIKGGLSVRGRRVVLAGTGPLLLPVASTLARAGARLALVAEQAPPAALGAFACSLWRSPERLAAAMLLRGGFAGVPYRAGRWVARADGDKRVEEVTVTDGARSWRERCDLLACGYGLVPSTELARLIGCALSRSGIAVDDAQRTSVDRVYAAGECTGIGGAPLSVVEGEIAGLAAAGAIAVPRALAAHRATERAFAARVVGAFALRDELRALALPETIVCRCEDVPVGALDDAEDAREARLHTRAGMGACQGRVCGAALEVLRGWEPAAARPPLFPAPLAALAELDDPRA